MSRENGRTSEAIASFLYEETLTAGEGLDIRALIGAAAGQPISFGTSSERLELDVAKGGSFFDTDLGIPVFSDGTKWTNYAGATVDGTGIYTAFGFQSIYPLYGGPLIRLRRGSDNVQSDFYKAASGTFVDTAAITTWLGGATGYLHTLYDQSGRSNNYTQTTAGNQAPIVIDGDGIYVAFANTKQMLPAAEMLNFARFVDGNTVGIRARVPTLPDAQRSLWLLSQGDGITQNRIAIIANTAGNVGAIVSTDDAVSGYATTPASVGTGWFTMVLQSNNRGGTLRQVVNGTAVSQLFDDAVKSPTQPSLGARINGSTTDSGLRFDFTDLILFQRPFSDLEADAMDLALTNRNLSVSQTGVIPTYGSVPYTILGIGDSMTRCSAISTKEAWLALIAESYNPYRPVRPRGINGNTSSQALTRLLAIPLVSTDTVIFWAGRNNLNKTQVMADLASAFTYVSSGKILFLTICNTVSEPSGSANHATILDINADILSTYPNNSLDIRSLLVAAYNPALPTDVYDHGRDCPPTSLLVDGQHFNVAGSRFVKDPIKGFIDNKGW